MVARIPQPDRPVTTVRVCSLDRLAQRQLDGGGPWTVHSVFEGACNLVGPDGELLGIVQATGGNAAATLVLDAGGLREPLSTLLSPGDSVRLSSDVILVRQRLRVELAGAKLWTPTPIIRKVSVPEVQRRLMLAAENGGANAPAGGLASLLSEALALADGSAVPPHTGTAHDLIVERARHLLSDLAAAIRERRWSDTRTSARALSGLGPGLTPAGDDLLAGLALGLRAGLGALPPEFGAALTDAVVGRTTDLAAARVRHAAAGHPDERVHRLLHVLVMDTDSDTLPAAVRSLLEYGHSSGADTLVGLLTGASLGVRS